MFFRIIKRTFWMFYDNLFRGMFLNLLLFLILLLVFIIGVMKSSMYITTVAVIVALWHIVSPALIYYWYDRVQNNDPDPMFKVVGRGLKKFWYKGLGVFAVNLVFYTLAFMSINFYKNIADSGQWAYILGGIGLWIVLMVTLMQIYIIPIMVLDEKRRVLISFKKSVIMILSAPFSALFIFILAFYLNLLLWPVLHFQGAHPPQLLSLAALFPLFVMPFVTYTSFVLMQLNATMIIYEKHKLLEPLDKVWEDRTLSNLFRPWENKVK